MQQQKREKRESLMNTGDSSSSCSLLPHPYYTATKLPKLDVAGSIPVSRSIFSMS